MQILILIINIILALSAISASIFAALTLRQAYQFKRNERESRRAFFAPSEDPGYLKITDILDDDPRLLVKLKNYGNNPAEKINVTLISFNSSDVDGTNQNVEPVFKLLFDAQNPIPSTAEFTIYVSTQKLNNVGLDDFNIILSNFIAMKVVYFDRVLNRTFEDQFYWRIEDNGKLFEVTDEYIQNLKDLSNKFFVT